MKSKFLLFILIGFLLFPMFSYAETVRVDGLSQEQKLKLELAVEKIKNESDEDKKFTPDKMQEWVDLGKNVGLALASVAGQLGVATDKFLESNTGKIAVILIVWKLMGSSVIGLFVGMLFLAIWVPLWFYSFRRMCIIKSIRYEYPKEGWKKVKTVEYYDTREDSYHAGNLHGTRLIFSFIFIILLIISGVIIF